MIHLEIVGSNPSPRGLSRLGSYVDGSRTRIGSPSMYPTSRGSARLIRIPSDRLPSRSARRALQRSTPPHDPIPLPEPADADDPAPYIATVNNAIASYNTTPTSSGRSSPLNVETQSTLSQGGWTTGNTTERSSLDSSCYSLDEFDRQAASTVNQHFEEFESFLYEGPRETASSIHRECQEWSTQFPHLRVLGKQVVAPTDTGYHFVSLTSNLTPRPSTSGTLDLNITDHDLSFASDTQGLTLSGRKVKASRPPTDASSPLTREPTSSTLSEYDFLHEEVFAQDGIYEDIIAVDYKNIYEDNMEHKKQITPRRRRVGYPPITPNACVKDSVCSGAFDSMWHEIMSWMRSLLRKYATEVLESKKDEADYALGHPLALTPPFRASSFIMPSRPFSNQGNPFDGNFSLDGMLKVSSMALRNRNTLSSEQPESPLLMNAPTSIIPAQKISRPSTVHHPQNRLRARRLEPLQEPVKEEGRKRESPQGSLHVRQIMPPGPQRLSSPPTTLTRLSTLPPLESSSTQPHRRHGFRVSSAIDNKEGRSLAARERSNNSVEASRPSTTQAFRSETPYSGLGNRRSSTPLGQSAPTRHSQFLLMHGNGMPLGITGSGIHPSAEPGQIPSNILEDHEGPLEDGIRHNQWMPTATNQSFYRRMRPHLRL